MVEGQSCGAEPSDCGIWHSPRIDGVRVELVLSMLVSANCLLVRGTPPHTHLGTRNIHVRCLWRYRRVMGETQCRGEGLFSPTQVIESALSHSLCPPRFLDHWAPGLADQISSSGASGYVCTCLGLRASWKASVCPMVQGTPGRGPPGKGVEGFPSNSPPCRFLGPKSHLLS